MNSKLISFIKVFVSIIIVILFIAMICFVINLDRQNKKLNQTKYELTITIDMQNNTIDRLSQNNDKLNAEIVQLIGTNNKLQEDNKLANEYIQKLLTQIEELKEEKKNEIITPLYNDFKSYLPYDAITNQSSKQWQLQQIATTNKDGIRCIDEIPMVAVGTGWGLSVGDIAMVTCDNGNSFKVMIGDIKADIHTDIENKTTIASGCRCEFIVELDKLDPQVKSMGSVAILAKYSGYVINVEKIGQYN